MSDDLDDDELNLDESFDDFDKKERTLGDLWRESPLVKIGVIIGGIVLIFLIIMMFSGGDKKLDPSYIGASPDLTSVPATDQASPAFIEAIEETNEAAVEQAFKEGTSALPVPIEPPVGVISVPEADPDQEDPLQRWRRLQEERLQREIQQRDTIAPIDTRDDIDPNEAIQALSDLMSQQMSSVLESLEPPKVQSMSLTGVEFLEKLEAARQEEEELKLAELEDETSEEIIEKVLLPGGRILYAQLLTEANSDIPGPVLVELMSGPLKGNRLLGSFEVNSELLTLSFDTIIIGDENISIDAVALDPNTTLPGLATEVDHRYFKRIILPAAAAFVEGMTQAISESGATTITVSGENVTESTNDATNDQEVASGINEAGQEVREILDEIADETEVLVRIAAGTPLGILFLEPVVQEIDPASDDK